MDAETNELIQKLFCWFDNKDVVLTEEAMQKNLLFTTKKISIY